MSILFEIDCEIEAVCDKCGDFPLQCAILLFDLLGINGNIIVKNQFSIKEEKKDALQKYNKNVQNSYYEWPNSPEGNYCIWIKESFDSNIELIDILKLQGTYLSYIVPSNSFDWEKFTKEWQKDDKQLLLTKQASFICNILDMDRTLNLNFNVAEFPKEKITSVIEKWEDVIKVMAKSTQIKRTVMQMRSKYGSKYLIQLKC